MPTIEDLRLLQALPLDIKIMKTKQRIREWVDRFGEENCMVSFSGGKDSTILLTLVRDMFPNIQGVFVNTGLEYPEIQLFVKTFDNIQIVRPKMRFDEVIKTYGYPFISKEVASCIYYAKKTEGRSSSRLARLNGTWLDKDGNLSIYNKPKYKPLLDVDFNISDRCCSVMKKLPAHSIKKAQLVATMADESLMRKSAWLKTGCNAFDNGKSTPMAFWKEQDVLQFIKSNDIKIASVYGNIVECGNDSDQLCIEGCGSKLKCTGCQRTGCIFCGFGAHCEDKGKGRFVMLKKTHPKQYDYCMRGGQHDENGIWQPNKDGLGMAHCIDELNKIYSKKGKDFIEY